MGHVFIDWIFKKPPCQKSLKQDSHMDDEEIKTILQQELVKLCRDISAETSAKLELENEVKHIRTNAENLTNENTKCSRVLKQRDNQIKSMTQELETYKNFVTYLSSHSKPVVNKKSMRIFPRQSLQDQTKNQSTFDVARGNRELLLEALREKSDDYYKLSENVVNLLDKYRKLATVIGDKIKESQLNPADVIGLGDDSRELINQLTNDHESAMEILNILNQ